MSYNRAAGYTAKTRPDMADDDRIVPHEPCTTATELAKLGRRPLRSEYFDGPRSYPTSLLEGGD